MTNENAPRKKFKARVLPIQYWLKIRCKHLKPCLNKCYINIWQRILTKQTSTNYQVSQLQRVECTWQKLLMWVQCAQNKHYKVTVYNWKHSRCIISYMTKGIRGTDKSKKCYVKCTFGRNCRNAWQIMPNSNKSLMIVEWQRNESYSSVNLGWET